MKEETVKLLNQYHQEQLLDYIPILNEEEQKALENQILTIDFEQIKQLYETTKQTIEIQENAITNIPYIDKAKLSQKELQELQELGEKVIRGGKHAVVTMAGGQGTRLGHSGPKGTYLFQTIYGPKYLFEILTETLKKANQTYQVTIPWYIMTSKENHQETVDFFKEHEYFGYDRDAIKFFTQGELPLLTLEGKVVLNEQKQIKEAANGNGSIFEAMRKKGVLDDMKKRGVEWAFIGSVDNILVKMVDPILTGLAISQRTQIACKSIVKANPQEKVGVFCKRNGKPSVIEYSELPKELAEATNEQGELSYGESHIMCNQFHINMLEKISNHQLPYHIALKKNSYMSAEGKMVTPQEPNLYKFEAFIFDAFERCDNMSILRVKREEEFAPVKNKEGNDSPETAVKLYNEEIKKERK